MRNSQPPSASTGPRNPGSPSIALTKTLPVRSWASWRLPTAAAKNRYSDGA
jgi:hypothetical protein